MRIREFSDLHLEIAPYIIPAMPDDKETTLVLAGDICSFGAFKHYELLFFKLASKMFKHVVYVPGNHESYRYNISKVKEKFEEIKHDFKLHNIHMLNRDTLVIDDVAFIGATLWTDMNKGSPFTMIDAAQGMNDYRVIRSGPNYRRLKPIDTAAIHVADKNYIAQELNRLRNEVRKTVVVTHHAMSELSVHDKWRGNSLNHAYFSNMEEFIFDNVPDVCFHGHMHDTFHYKLGVTDVYCNPRGYAHTFVMKDKEAAFAKIEAGELWTPTRDEFDAVWTHENKSFDPFFSLDV